MFNMQSFGTSTTDHHCKSFSMGMLLKSAGIVAVSLSTTLLMGCNKTEQAEPEVTVAETNEPAAATHDVIRVATEGAYAPFNYTDSNGELQGFDVDLVNALCDEMKAKCEIVAQDWEGIIPGLKIGKYDAIIAGMSITPDRSKQVAFTDPYFTNSLVFITKEGSDFNPSDRASLAGKKIATQTNTVSATWLEDNLPEAEPKLYDTLTNAFLELESGRVDGLLSDKAPAINWLSNDKAGYTLVGDEIDIDDVLGIAVRKDDAALKQEFNTALAALKENGTYQTLSDKYFTVAATN